MLGEEVNPKLLAEKKVQIDKAKARVDALRKELAEKRQQLVGGSARPGQTFRRDRGLQYLDDRSQDLPDVKTAIVERVSPSILEYHPAEPRSSLSPSDRERLESLEKKLAKLLDEIASLKKHDEKTQ